MISESIKKNYFNNRIFFLIFIIYLSYLIFQIIPLPLNWIEIIASNNYDLYSSIKIDKEFWSLSIDPSSSYFSILNCINYLIIFLIFSVYLIEVNISNLAGVPSIYLLHAIFATYWMLIGNPSNFLIEKIHYINASTGLFVNRSVFGTFLFLCAFSGLYFIVIFFQKNKTTDL